MPISLDLVENGHILHYVYTDPWTANELFDLNAKAEDYYRNSPHIIHTIADTRKLGQVPSGVLRARSVPNLSEPNSGEIVVIGAGYMVETVSSVIFRMAHFDRVKFIKDEATAWEYLRGVIAREAQEPAPEHETKVG